VAVTHDQEEALTMSDRIAVMNGGRVLQVGTPREIYELPATRFVADFIGTSNFLTGTLGPGRTVDVPGVGALPAPDTELPDGAQVQLAVRPEKVRLARSESAFGPGGPALPATLRQSIYLGHGVRYHLELADGSTVVAEHRGSPDDLPAVGRQVWVGWSPAHSRVLDR
jgi:ABC-type Fe3+/spermidine/putrescine transport system ATPase subunit